MFIDPDDIINKNALETISEVIICQICTGIVVHPMQCKSCDTSFCKICIEKWSLKSKICPLKCANFGFKEASRVVMQMLGKLELMCPDECGAKISYDNLDKHLKDCNKETLTCPCCKSQVLKNSIDKRELFSTYRENKELQVKVNNLESENSKLQEHIQALTNKIEENKKEMKKFINEKNKDQDNEFSIINKDDLFVINDSKKPILEDNYNKNIQIKDNFINNKNNEKSNRWQREKREKGEKRHSKKIDLFDVIIPSSNNEISNDNNQREQNNVEIEDNNGNSDREFAEVKKWDFPLSHSMNDIVECSHCKMNFYLTFACCSNNNRYCKKCHYKFSGHDALNPVSIICLKCTAPNHLKNKFCSNCNSRFLHQRKDNQNRKFKHMENSNSRFSKNNESDLFGDVLRQSDNSKNQNFQQNRRHYFKRNQRDSSDD